MPRPKAISLSSRSRKSGPGFDLLFLGDTSFGESYQENRARSGGENILKTRGYESSLANMIDILASVDFVVANLETPVTDLAVSPFAGRKPYIHKGDVVKTPETLAKHRIGAVSLANNHACDYGVAGLEQTLRVLEAWRLPCFGAGHGKADSDDPLLLELKADSSVLRIALFAAYDAPAAAEERSTGAASDGPRICLLNADRIGCQIRKLKSVHPDLLSIAFPHWGRNYAWRSGRQRRLSESLFDAGIDLILGHGAHMLQEVGARDGKWVVFSLGNFVFNSPGRYGKYGAPPFSLVAKLVARPKQGRWLVSLRLYPIVTDNAITDYRTRFVNDDEFETVRQLIATKSDVPSLREGMDASGRYLRLPVRFGSAGHRNGRPPVPNG